MQIPARPPTSKEILMSLVQPGSVDRLVNIIMRGGSLPHKGEYLHWDKLRRLRPPEGMTAEEWWAAIKFSRSQGRRWVTLKDKNGEKFSYCTPDAVLELLHEIDTGTSGPIDSTSEPITNPQTKDRYIQRSLIEEAITSSQLEGASTTRRVAKDMIRSGRSPRDVNERMILNNYRAIQLIGKYKEQQLTPELIFEIHKTITEGTLNGNASRRNLRTSTDGVAVYDNRDNTLLHMPPHADEIEQRMLNMCEFANRSEKSVFLHPVVKSIILHFWLAYDHPFVDGNGRMARALFYWMMLHQKFWMFEFLSISEILRKAPVAYGRSFLYVETDENDLTYFILSQLKVIKQSIDNLQEYVRRKTEEIRQTEQLFRASVSLNARQIALLSHALRHPGMRYTIASHRTSNGVTYQTARADLMELSQKRLLVCSRAGRYFVFSARENLHTHLRRLK